LTVTFLGTGTSQGVPVIGCTCPVCSSLDFRDKRLRTSVHVEIGDLSLVIDTGPDFRQQVLRERIKKLDAVLFTHAHKDHTAGLDDIRAYNFRQKIEMPLFGAPEVLAQIKREFEYIFNNLEYPGIPRVKLNEVFNEPFSINGCEITPIQVFHYRLPVFGFRIKDFTYITDANSIPEPEFEKLKGTKVLVLNALQKEWHISHFNLQEAIDIVKKVNPEVAYFVHMSHNIGTHDRVSRELPANIHLAFDGQKLIL
jgi:phosphoribosyl 1,2-cyclic phosphate phosphodiesterase